MSESNSKKTITTKTQPSGASARDSSTAEADVLYQRMGNQWYSYCVVDDEVFVGKVPEEILSDFNSDLDGEKSGPKK